MPYLKMYVGNVSVDKIILDYTGLDTCTDKENYQQREVERLKLKHQQLVADIEPVFVVECESNMNTHCYE